MKDDVKLLLRRAREAGVQALDEPTGKELLASAGINVPRSVVVDVGSDPRPAVARLRGPFVLKVVATGVVHKSDVGGVRLNLRDADEVAHAVDELDATLQRHGIEAQAWLVEEMAPRGVEVVGGGMMDAEFGPMVMVGLGGVFVEVLKDVAFRICPIDARDAREMIDELQGAALLRGARGSEPVAIDAIVQVLLRLGGEGGLLFAGENELAEVDINPLIVSRDAAVAVDARFILRQPE